jgi:SAM-dependent methyltransferase
MLIYGLQSGGVSMGDCEDLPYASNAFDLVYSWGVIHHTPNPRRALEEIVRVCRPGGVCKLMVYNRHSLLAMYLWARWALARGRPWMSVSNVIATHMESAGTQAYTEREVRELLSRLYVTNVRIESFLTRDDCLGMLRSTVARRLGQIPAQVLGNRRGWFMTVQFSKALPAGSIVS